MIKTNQALLDYFSAQLAALKAEGLNERLPIRVERLTKGERLIWQGETPDAVFCIVSGIVKCFITEENGRDYLLEFLGEGELVGELEILTQSDYISTIETLTDLQVMRIDLAFFRKLLHNDPVFNELIMRELAVRLVRTARRASYQQTYPIEYAILKILYLFSVHKEAISKQDLADYLAITVRSLNRLLKQLTKGGIVRETSLGLILSNEQLQQALSRFDARS